MMTWFDQNELQGRILQQNALLHQLAHQQRTLPTSTGSRSVASMPQHGIPFNVSTFQREDEVHRMGNHQLEKLLIQNAQMHQLVMAHMLRETPMNSQTNSGRLYRNHRIADDPVYHSDTLDTVTTGCPPPVEVPPPACYPGSDTTSSSWQERRSLQSRRSLGKQRKHSQQYRQVTGEGTTEDGVPMPSRGRQRARAFSVTSVQSQLSVKSKRHRDVFISVSRRLPYPFPGNESAKRLRRVFWVSFFCAILSENLQKGRVKRAQSVKRLETMMLDARECCHQLFLSDDVPVKSIVCSLVSSNAKQLLVKSRGIFRRTTGDDKAALRALSAATEQLLDEVVHITPSSSGLNQKLIAYVRHLIQPRTSFPADYLWSLEKDYLTFDRLGQTKDVSTESALALFLCFFVLRCLITTIVLNPQEYRIVRDRLSDVAYSNVKTVASFVVYIVRHCLAASKGVLKSAPEEIAGSLYTDDEMKFVYKKLSRVVHSYQAQLSQWGLRFLEEVKAERR